MGLGGLTRDSIVGLNNLVHDDDDDSNNCYEQQGHRRNLSLNTSHSNSGGRDFFILDGDDDEGIPGEQSVALAGGMETNLTMGDSTTMTATTTTMSRSSSFRNNVQAINNQAAAAAAAVPMSPKAHSGTKAAYQFQYEDYTDYYAEDFSPYNYDYDGGNGQTEGGNIFCCLFAPWLAGGQKQPESQLEAGEKVRQEGALNSTEDQTKVGPDPEQVQQPPSQQATSSATNDSSAAVQIDSSSSDVPPLTSSAHTKPASADKKSSSLIAQDEEKKDDTLENNSNKPTATLENKNGQQVNQEEEQDSGPKPPKSILKVKHAIHLIDDNLNNKNGKANGNSKTPTTKDGKRHLFPTYEPKKSHSSSSTTTNGDINGENNVPTKPEHSVNFNPMARVLTIPSRKDIPLSQKSQIWWQKCDYDEFKKTGRIISKAMECGGSEIWLNSSNAWGSRQQSKQLKDSSTTSSNGASGGVNDEEYNQALKRYGVNEEKKDDNTSSNDGNKWWCKFGHSRRGLEHIASNEEGKARQSSVLLAIRMVLEEQKRQRIARNRDSNKLRTVAIQYTSWARDLALAAGAADAEAVKTNFDGMAKSRAHYFAKRWNTSGSSPSSSAMKLSSSPLTSSFMNVDINAVGGGVARAITSQILDANTHARRASAGDTSASPKSSSSHGDDDDTMSKRAKGFSGSGSGDGDNMAAVLSGMGTRSRS